MAARAGALRRRLAHALTMLANRRAARTEFDLLESLGAVPAALSKTIRSQPTTLNRALPTIGDWICEAKWMRRPCHDESTSRGYSEAAD